MCGYVGCLYNTAKSYSKTEKIQFENMTNLLYHRGPDDQGYFRDEHVQFGFRRLSIIDLDAGHQPLTYENERYILMFNGEIYNYIELREMLIKQGVKFFNSVRYGSYCCIICSCKRRMCKTSSWNVYFCYLGPSREKIIWRA